MAKQTGTNIKYPHQIYPTSIYLGGHGGNYSR